jgi:hypothetical protein
MTRPTIREWAEIWKDERPWTGAHGLPNLDGLPFCIDCAGFPEGRVMNFPSRCFNCGRNMRHRKLHSHTDINCFCTLTCKEVVLTRRRVQNARGALCRSAATRPPAARPVGNECIGFARYRSKAGPELTRRISVTATTRCALQMEIGPPGNPIDIRNGGTLPTVPSKPPNGIL